MATCAPTARTRAPTVLKSAAAPQLVALLHTVNWRRLPSAGGAAAGRSGAAPGSRCEAATPARAACSLPRRRSTASNRPAGVVGPAGAARSWASMGAVPRVAVRRVIGDDWPNVPATDCATTRYSAESVLDALAGNVTYPPVDAGSINA